MRLSRATYLFLLLRFLAAFFCHYIIIIIIIKYKIRLPSFSSCLVWVFMRLRFVVRRRLHRHSSSPHDVALLLQNLFGIIPFPCSSRILTEWIGKSDGTPRDENSNERAWNKMCGINSKWNANAMFSTILTLFVSTSSPFTNYFLLFCVWFSLTLWHIAAEIVLRRQTIAFFPFHFGTDERDMHGKKGVTHTHTHMLQLAYTDSFNFFLDDDDSIGRECGRQVNEWSRLLYAVKFWPWRKKF